MSTDPPADPQVHAPAPEEFDASLGEVAADDVMTSPLPTLPAPPVPRKTGPFRIYSPHDPDLSDDMRREIEIRMTAGYWLHKAIQAENQVEMPDEYNERYAIWKLISHESLALLGFLFGATLFLSGWLTGWLLTVPAVLLLASLVAGLYVFKLWSITYVVVTGSKTGISRRRVRWLLINEIKPELSTRDLIVSLPFRNLFFSTFNINWWRVSLDTAAQEESNNVRKMSFIRDGDRMVQTIEQFKRALN